MSKTIGNLVIALIVIAAVFLVWRSYSQQLSLPSMGDFGGWSSWLKNLFGSSTGDDSDSSTTVWLAPVGSGISSQPLPQPTTDQISNVQSGLQDYEQFANSPEAWQNQAADFAMQQLF